MSRKRRKRKSKPEVVARGIELEPIPADVGTVEEAAEKDFIESLAGEDFGWSKDLEDQCHRLVYASRQAWAAAAEEWRTKAYMLWILSRGWNPAPRRERRFGANIKLPIPDLHVSNVASRYHAGMFDSERWFRVLPWHDGDNYGAENLEAVLRYSENVGNWIPKFRDTLQVAGILGHCDLMGEFCRETRKVLKFVPSELSQAEESIEPGDHRVEIVDAVREERVYEYIKFTPVHPFDVLQDPKCPTPQDAQAGSGYLIRHVLSLSKVDEMVEREFFNSRGREVRSMLVAKKSGARHPKTGREMSGHQEYVGFTPLSPEPFTSGGDRMPTIANWDEDWWSYGLKTAMDIASGISEWQFQPFPDMPDDTKVVAIQVIAPRWVAERKQMVMCDMWQIGPFTVRCHEWDDPTGILNFFRARIKPIPFTMFGDGALGQNASAMMEIDELEQLKLEGTALAGQPCFLSSTTTGFATGKQPKIAPANILEVRNVNGVKWLDPPQGLERLQGEQSFLINLIREASGLTNILLGSSPGNRATSNEISTLQAESMTVHKDAIARMSKEWVEPMISWAAGQMQARMTQPLSVRLLGERGLTPRRISREDIMGRYEFRIEGPSAQAGANMHVSQLHSLLGILGNWFKIDPTIGQRFNVAEMVAQVAEIQGMRGRERWYKPANKRPPVPYEVLLEMGAINAPLVVDPEDDHMGFAQWWTTPAPPPEDMTLPPISPMERFMARLDIPLEHRVNFLKYASQRMSIATAQVQQQQAQQAQQMMMQSQQQMMSPPGAPGSTVARPGAGVPPGGGFPGAGDSMDPSQMPQTTDGLMRQLGGDRFAAMAGQPPGI